MISRGGPALPSFGPEIPTNKKDGPQKSKMPVLSSIVYALKQDKAQHVRGLTVVCLVLPHKTVQ